MPKSIWSFWDLTTEVSVQKCNYVGVFFLPAELCSSGLCSQIELVEKQKTRSSHGELQSEKSSG